MGKFSKVIVGTFIVVSALVNFVVTGTGWSSACTAQAGCVYAKVPGWTIVGVAIATLAHMVNVILAARLLYWGLNHKRYVFQNGWHAKNNGCDVLGWGWVAFVIATILTALPLIIIIGFVASGNPIAEFAGWFILLMIHGSAGSLVQYIAAPQAGRDIVRKANVASGAGEQKPSVDDNNNYAIQWAAKNGHTKTVALLLKEERVDPSVDDNNYALRWA